jgi:hypothetical protein
LNVGARKNMFEQRNHGWFIVDNQKSVDGIAVAQYGLNLRSRGPETLPHCMP